MWIFFILHCYWTACVGDKNVKKTKTHCMLFFVIRKQWSFHHSCLKVSGGAYVWVNVSAESAHSGINVAHMTS